MQGGLIYSQSGHMLLATVREKSTTGKLKLFIGSKTDCLCVLHNFGLSPPPIKLFLYVLQRISLLEPRITYRAGRPHREFYGSDRVDLPELLATATTHVQPTWYGVSGRSPWGLRLGQILLLVQIKHRLIFAPQKIPHRYEGLGNELGAQLAWTRPAPLRFSATKLYKIKYRLPRKIMAREHNHTQV